MVNGSMNIIEDRQEDGRNNEYPLAQPDWRGLGELSVQHHKILAAAQPELPKSFRSWGRLPISVMMTMVYN